MNTPTPERSVEEIVEDIWNLFIQWNEGEKSSNTVTRALTQTLQTERQKRDEMVDAVRMLKKKEYVYEHTYPNEIGVDMGNGYEKRISKGQKETLKHHLDDEELLYNQAIDDALQTLTPPQ